VAQHFGDHAVDQTARRLVAVGLKPALQARLAELLVARALGLGHTVGVEDEAITRGQLELQRGEVGLGGYTESHGGGRQRDRLLANGQQERRVVAAVEVVEPPADGVQLGVEERDRRFEGMWHRGGR